jgi:hypothetical protein
LSIPCFTTASYFEGDLEKVIGFVGWVWGWIIALWIALGPQFWEDFEMTDYLGDMLVAFVPALGASHLESHQKQKLECASVT